MKRRQRKHKGPPAPPIRFCARCRKRLTRKRVMHKSFFCGERCRANDERERRAYRASKECRLCGRPARFCNAV